ncbi:TonB-dependent receptor domain-containing protein [Sphingobium bisphenolivorans]|uniref:TonB-dependent receptor domain-containing protein n=1 Tax=Sphingobium bisphenolivorans TaxID=1335760 RepID=UPI00039CBC54|nr:TonB-dependent receptor [Sphingobium bisphenolivorans]
MKDIQYGLPRLTVSVDAYRVSIKDAIGTQSIADQLADCQTSGGTAPVCALIERPFPFSNATPANFPTKIRVVPQNLARLLTKGIDFEVSYRIPLPSLDGDLTLRAFANYLDTYDTQGAASQPVLHRAGRATADQEPFGLQKWKGLLTQAYNGQNFSLSFTERFTGKYTYGSPNQVFAKPFVVPNRVYVDANLAATVGSNKQFELFLNVQNLFDLTPPEVPIPLIANISVATDKTAYDVVGRYFTAGVRLKL